MYMHLIYTYLCVFDYIYVCNWRCLWNWLNSHLVSGTLLCECARLGGLGPRTHTYTCSHVKFGDSFFGVGAKHLRSMNNGSSRFGSALCCSCGWKEGECYLVSMWMGGMYTWVLSMLVHGTIENMDENCMIDRWKNIGQMFDESEWR
jgi:hypothetical protein